jgi:hypothetical protein
MVISNVIMWKSVDFVAHEKLANIAAETVGTRNNLVF